MESLKENKEQKIEIENQNERYLALDVACNKVANQRSDLNIAMKETEELLQSKSKLANSIEQTDP